MLSVILVQWLFCFSYFFQTPEFAKYDIDRYLTRTLYPPFKWNDERKDWRFSPNVMAETGLRIEEFMQYFMQTNTVRRGEDGERIPSFTPMFDFFASHVFIPMQCISVEEDKYKSPLIAYVKSDS